MAATATVQVFDVVVLKLPTQKEIEEQGMTEQIILDKRVVAPDRESVSAVVMSGWTVDVPATRLKVLVRPFCS